MSCSLTGAALGLATILSNIEESNYDGDVVHHALLSGPPLYRLFHQKVDGAVCILVLVEAVNNCHHNFVVGESVPDTIRTHHEYLVVLT